MFCQKCLGFGDRAEPPTFIVQVRQSSSAHGRGQSLSLIGGLSGQGNGCDGCARLIAEHRGLKGLPVCRYRGATFGTRNELGKHHAHSGLARKGGALGR